jgi:hypothetical protein
MLNITTSLYKLTFQQATLTALEKASEATATVTLQAQTESNMQRAVYRGRKLFQLDVNYRWSDVVFDERFAKADGEVVKNAYGVEGQDVRAGDRAPDAPGLVCLGSRTGKTPGRLFDIYSPCKHTVLVFANGAPDKAKKPIVDSVILLPSALVQKVIVLPSDADEVSTPQVLDTTIYDYVVKDVDGHGYQGFGVGAGGFTVVVVRPDGMVGGVAVSEAGLKKYVCAVFSQQAIYDEQAAT